MSTLITNRLKEHICEQIAESLSEPANNVYYIVASRHTEWDQGDTSIPNPTQSEDEINTRLYQEALFGKKITPDDVELMIPRYDWTANTVYSRYDNEDTGLFDKQFYVVVDQGATYYVYKCLDNNNGLPSTVQPISTSESACNFVTTADNYKWKLMYKMDEAKFEKFAFNDYIPVETSANVAGNSIFGAVDSIFVVNNGSNYVATLTGQFQTDDLRELIPTTTGSNLTYRLPSTASSNSNFYVGSAIYITAGTGAGQQKRIVDYNASTRVATVNSAFTVPPSTDSTYLIAPDVVISGDGVDAVGYGVVTSNSSVNNFISEIKIVNRGSNYSYGTAIITGNTGGVSNTATARVVIPPFGGHGTNAPEELGCKNIGISIQFSNNESGFVTTENDYRKLSLIRDPLFKSVTFTIGTEAGTFNTGERVHQVDYKILAGTVAVNTSSPIVTGIGTYFDKSFVSGDYALITDTVAGISTFRQVQSVSNSSHMTLVSNSNIISSFCTIASVEILASAVKTGNSSPYVTCSNVEPKFVTGKLLVGESSGATANVTAINVNEKNYNNWLTFDNRTRISYTANTGAFTSDATVFQSEITLSNAFFHSANDTYVFLTSEKGPINADPDDPLYQLNEATNYTLGSVKYEPDLVKGSGKTLYIENNSPITRSNTQSENIKILLKF